MKTKRADELEAALFSTNDGRIACDAINRLSKLVGTGNVNARKALARYVADGSIGHMRTHACAMLAEAPQLDAETAAIFRRGLSDPVTRYWSILGAVNFAGRDAYEELVGLALNKQVELVDRANAIKRLALHSGQNFDRGLPGDPGYWKDSDLRLDELQTWAARGFPEGPGYSQPKRHPALDEPATFLEELVSKLDKNLAKLREKDQDPADPTNWLAIADPAAVAQIKERWELPSVYLDFLNRFSPVKVIIHSRRFYNGLRLFGAGELIQGQDGYSFNPVEGQPIPDWPASLVVVASHGGDPYVLDLSKSNGTDAPVYTAAHGAGEWKFKKVAGSFCAFLEKHIA